MSVFSRISHLFGRVENKMILRLLSNANLPCGRDIRPRSLEVTSISALVFGVVKGNANSLHLAARGGLSPQAARNAAKIYSRDTTRQKLCVSKFAHGDIHRRKFLGCR